MLLKRKQASQNKTAVSKTVSTEHKICLGESCFHRNKSEVNSTPNVTVTFDLRRATSKIFVHICFFTSSQISTSSKRCCVPGIMVNSTSLALAGLSLLSFLPFLHALLKVRRLWPHKAAVTCRLSCLHRFRRLAFVQSRFYIAAIYLGACGFPNILTVSYCCTTICELCVLVAHVRTRRRRHCPQSIPWKM
jgi:hypothetical protein